MKTSDCKAIDFVKNALQNFIKDFPQTRVRYEYSEESNVHCIEIVPNEVYYLNETYINWENQLTDNFIEQFVDQNICFITSNSLVGLDEIHYELVGKFYLNRISVNSSAIIDVEPKITINTSQNSTSPLINTTCGLIYLESLNLYSQNTNNSVEANGRSENSQNLIISVANTMFPLAA